MKKRIILIVKGDVQKVGYRDVVKEIATDFGIKGYVENMRNSDVQIVCEADEELLPKFIDALKIKKDFINVGGVKVVEQSDATGEFEYFDIKYGRLEEEFGDRAGTMILYLGGIHGNVNKVHSSVNKVHSSVNKVGEKVDRVGDKVDQLRNEMRDSFNKMDKKYDVIFKTMLTMNENLLAGQKQSAILNENLASTQEQLTKVVDKLTVIVDRFIENEKDKDRKIGRSR